MPTYLLDTEHLSLFEHRHPVVRFRVDSQPSGDVCLCPVTAEEIVRGRLASIARHRTGPNLVTAYRRLVESLDLLHHFPIVPFDSAAETEFQSLLAGRLRIGTMDMRIAAVALVNNLTVLTRNTRDFGKAPGLKFADWSV
jgi:tRNA(fMet)-specific endonuclease VapC